jgi:hypothetical protein
MGQRHLEARHSKSRTPRRQSPHEFLLSKVPRALGWARCLVSKNT